MSAIQRLTKVFTKEERQYHVCGEIIFKFKKLFDDRRESSPELRERLLQAIRTADALFPWQDYGHIHPWDKQESVLPSIGELVFTGDQYNNWAVPEFNIWFRLQPTAVCIRKGQLHAYEKYLETLAEMLSKMDEVEHVATVRCICRFSKSSAEFRG